MHLVPAPTSAPTTADALAAHLATAEPSSGPWDELDFEHLSPDGEIDALTACERLTRHAQSLHVRAWAAVFRRHEAEGGSTSLGLAELEASTALHLSANATRMYMDQSATLTQRFPETLAALAAGSVSWRQTQALLEATHALDHDTARAVQDRVLHLMPRQCPAATVKALRRAVLAVDPDGADRRHEHEVARRRVTMRPEEDGMATVELYTTAQLGTALLAAVDQHAKARTEGDTRSLDQRRADVLTALVLGAACVRDARTQGTEMPQPTALVQVTVGIGTLLGTDQMPGELRGYGPITATQARALAFAPGSMWRRLITRPDGSLLHADPHTYRPTAAVARFVQLRDQSCTFPGCGMPAQRCDLDHIEPFDHARPGRGGASVPENLHALCRRHHRAKTAQAWNVTRDRDTGVATWTSPLGRIYAAEPKTYLAVA